MSSVNGSAPLRVSPGLAGTGTTPGGRTSSLTGQETGAFARTLDEAIGTSAPVRFSGHAAERIRARGIQLSPGDLTRLGRAVDLAASKGGRDSLVLSPSLAYVVHVPSRTVVTAMAGDQAKESVFTNIDSAVVL